MPSFYDRRPASRTSTTELHASMLGLLAGDLPLCENCQAPVVKKGSGTWTHATHGYATCRGVDGGRAKPQDGWTPPAQRRRA